MYANIEAIVRNLTRATASLFLAICALTQANAQTSTSADAKVQVPELKAPERASLAGQLSSIVFGPGDLPQGAYTLPDPFDAPRERGAPLATPFPRYSPANGISEWGVGWQSTLAITRVRLSGDLDYLTDDLSGPFGRMVKGSDGAWYPVGLSKRVRVVEGTDTLSAYLPDGTLMVFGGAARVKTPKGTYAWHLTEVTTVTGRKTRVDWATNATGRLFVTGVLYGGVGDDYQYRIDLSYEALGQAFEDFRSGQLLTLDRRVSGVTVLAKSASTREFAERWRYELSYQDEGFGPGFYLASVQQVFASGARPPPATYGYYLSSAKLAAARLESAPKVTSLLAATSSDVLAPTRSTVLDVDDDGLPDLEWSYDYRLIRQTEDGFMSEALPAVPDASASCRTRASDTNRPRVILRSGTGNEGPHVVDLQTDSVNTWLTVCNRLGQKQYSAKLSGAWALSPSVRLVDLNHDHRPDLIRLGVGQYEVLPNNVASATFAFGKVKVGKLTPVVQPDTAWIHDMNGDGLPDLVGRYSTGLVVWYGKGNLEFETAGRTFGFEYANGSAVTLSTFGLTFVDANKDGLMDVLLSGTSSNQIFLFMNRGRSFRQVMVPGLSAADSLASAPVVLDLQGSGNTEVTFTSKGAGWSVSLDGPETGLMAWADDGRGTTASFEYGRAAPSPAAKQRQSVLARLSVDSSGQSGISYSYAYGSAKLHSVGQFLLGYDQVQRTTSVGSDWSQFLNDDHVAGLLLASTNRDTLAPGIEQFTEQEYEDATYQGIAWKRHVSTVSGWRATDGSGVRTFDRTRTTGWWGDFCRAQVVKETSAGTLTTDTQYSDLSAFAGYLACLPADIVETGAHAGAELDFRHETVLTRNAVGLVTRVASVAPGNEPWTVQQVSYTPEWLVESVSAPGLGTTTATYEPITRLLQGVTSPDAVEISAAERDPVTGNVTLLRTARGVLVHDQRFAFDGQERLESAWDNLGPSSALNPLLRYAYAFATASTPASVAASQLVETGSGSVRERVDLFAAGGEAIASGARIPEGWALGALTWRDPARGETTSYLREAVPSLAGVEYSKLLAEADPVGITTAGPFGVAVRTTALHGAVGEYPAVQHRAVDVLGIDSATGRLVRNVRENGTYDRTTATDVSRQAVAFWDEAGTSWRYVRDVLGRLRVVELPDGKKHRVDYDAHGRVARVSREGIATVEYAYAPSTGLLLKKAFIAPSGAIRRTINFTRDDIGRVRQELHTDAASGATKAFDFFFDGATPETPSARTAVGLLTAVAGDGYVKRNEYRADGKLTHRETELGGWRKIVSDLRYNDAGEPSGQTVRVYSGQTALLTTTRDDSYDAYGRVAGTTLDGAVLSTYSYDGQGRLASVAFSNGDWFRLEYDRLTRRQTGTVQAMAAYRFSTSRRLNDRGLVGRDDLQLGALSLTRNYGYSSQRFLTSSKDAQRSYGYAFDPAGLPRQIRQDGATTDLASSGSTLIAGSLTYVFDDLGRTIQRGDLVLSYGPDGQLATAVRASRTWSFVHDEVGQRLAKLEDGIPVAAYVPEGYLDGTQLVQTVKLAGRVVGLVRNGAFESIAADAVGSVLADADGTARIPSPFGARDVRPDRSAVIDYVEKGFDADLGLVRMGVRDYDPHTNRFSTPDPLFLEEPGRCAHSPAECNLYAYALGLPNQITDPGGLGDPIDVLEPVAANRDAYWNQAAQAFSRGGVSGVASGIAASGHYLFWGTMTAPALVAQATLEWVNAPALQIRGQVTGNAQEFYEGSARVAALQQTLFLSGLVRAGSRAMATAERAGGLSAAAQVLEGGTGRSLAGHGAYLNGSGTVTIPQGTTLTLWTEHGRGIFDGMGQLIEQGRYAELMANPKYLARMEGAASFLPGAEVPNYTLAAPRGLTVFSNSVTVDAPTLLGDLLTPGQGHIDWAACLKEHF